MRDWTIASAMIFVSVLSAEVQRANAASGTVYWTEYQFFSSRLMSMNLEGGDQQQVFQFEQPTYFPRGIAVDIEDDQVFWLFTTVTGHSIWRAKLDGTGAQEFWGLIGQNVGGLSIDRTNDRVLWADALGGCCGHAVFALDDAQTELVTVYQNGRTPITAPPLTDVANSRIYFGASFELYSTALNGTDIQPLATDPVPYCSMAVDSEHGDLYWLEWSSGIIKRMSLTGGAAETVHTTGAAAWAAADLEIDTVNDRLYWVDTELGQIHRVNIDGTNPIVLYTPPKGYKATAIDVIVNAATAGDITGDGEVDVDDLLAVINGWGPCDKPIECFADVAPEGDPAGNGVVDVDDLLVVINNWS